MRITVSGKVCAQHAGSSKSVKPSPSSSMQLPQISRTTGRVVVVVVPPKSGGGSVVVDVVGGPPGTVVEVVGVGG